MRANLCGALLIALTLECVGQSAQRDRMRGRQKQRFGKALDGRRHVARTKGDRSKVDKDARIRRLDLQRRFERLTRPIVVAKSRVGAAEQIAEWLR